MELIEKQIISNVSNYQKFDINSYNYLKQNKFNLFKINYKRNYKNSKVASWLVALGAALGVCDLPLLCFTGMISFVAMEASTVFIGSLLGLGGCAGIAFLGQLPTLIKSVVEPNDVINQAELDVENELVTDKAKSKVLNVFKRRKKIQQKTASLFAEIREANNILKDQNTSLTSENVAMKKEKEQLIEELGVCEDLKEAREELGVYNDIKAQRQELANRLLWLKEQMDNRHSDKDTYNF